MKTKRYLYLFFPVFCLACFALLGGCPLHGDDGESVPFAGGDGSLADPYQIATPEQLNAVRNHLTKSFVLTADIDLSGYANWEPIGRFEAVAEDDPENPRPEFAFTGNFDGQGYKISKVTVSSDRQFGVGLFGCAMGMESNTVLENVKLENVNVKGNWIVGGFVGYQYEKCLVRNIELDGDNVISGNSGLGGIIGGGVSDIENCSAKAVVIVNGDYGGSAGIVGGGIVECSIRDCSARGAIIVNGNNCFAIGGLAGTLNEGLEIRDCSADVTITATGSNAVMIGGLLGYTGTFSGDPTLIEDCSVNAVITAPESASRIGGLLGGSFYLEMYEELHPLPSSFAARNCAVRGAIVGGTLAGNIAGYAYKSGAENCTGSMSYPAALGQFGLAEDAFTLSSP